MPCVRQVLEKIRDLKLDLSHNLSMRILIISSPWTLFESSLLMLLISSIEKSTYETDLSIIKEKSDSNVLPLSFNEHCFVKKELRFHSFLWSQPQIFYLEKVVEYRVFFYHLKYSLIEFNNIWDKWLDQIIFLRLSCNIRIDRNWWNFVIYLAKHQPYQVI